MSRLTIDLFAEDRAHEAFLRALVLRPGKNEPSLGTFIDACRAALRAALGS